MSSKNDIKLLKEAFCDFFAKIMPYFPDPEQVIRKKWHQFRDFLLDEGHNPLDIFLFTQKLKFSGQSSPDKIKSNIKLLAQPSKAQAIAFNQKPSPNLFDIDQIPSFATPQTKRRQIGVLPAEVHNKLVTVRRRLADNAPHDRIQTDVLDNYNLKISIQTFSKQIDLDDSIKEVIQKYDAVELAGSPQANKAFPSFHQHNIKPSFSDSVKTTLLAEVTEALSLFRKHGTTLGCVYDKSFEINTGGISEEISHFQNRFASEQQQRLANIDTQQLQRNMAFKECSMYSKNRQHPIQRIEQALMQFQLPLQPPQKPQQQFLQLPQLQQGYQGRKDGRKLTGKKVYLQ